MAPGGVTKVRNLPLACPGSGDCMTTAMTEWTQVDLGDVEIRGVVWGWDKAWAYGCRRPADQLVPYVAHVRDDGAVMVYDMPSRGRISSVFMAADELAVCMGESPAELLYLSSTSPAPRFDDSHEPFLSGTRAWVTMGDEDPFYVAEWEDGRLSAGEPWHEDYPEGRGLRHLGNPQDLLVGSSDVAPFVAGLFSSGGHPEAVGLWTCTADMGPECPGGWEAVQLDPRPDGWTQIKSSSFPAFAGHLDGSPVVFTQRDGRVEAPDVALDPEHPKVLVPWSEYEVAVQSRDEGPQLWTRGEVGWQSRRLPPGRLDDAAVCTTSSLVWVVVDGKLWRPAGQPAQPGPRR